jgi:hypothetical protein
MGLDLFGEEYGEEHFIRNARRLGRDSGVDGVFNSSIGKVKGPWKIACAVRTSFNDAKTKVRHENSLARKDGYRGLFFITSFNATAPQSRELEILAKKGLKGAKVWCRARLERVLRDYAWIRQMYFGHVLIPGFVPIDDPSELDDRNQPDLEFVGRAMEIGVVREQIEGKPRIVVIVGNGGTGKSRLLRGLRDALKDTQPGRSTWLRVSGQGTVDEGLRSGLPARRPMVIALDDAADALSEVDELARLAMNRTVADVKLVLAIRSADRAVILERLGGLRDQVTWLDLRDLSAEEGARLARLECPALRAEDALRLSRAFGTNLFLLRAAAQQVKRGESPAEVVNDDHIRGLVARRFLAEAAKHLSSPPWEISRLIARLALNTPIPFSSDARDEGLAALNHSKLLRRVGNTLRFRRDVEGDILLAYLLEQPSHRATIEGLLCDPLEGEELQRQIRNLGAAGRGHATVIIGEFVRRWRTDPSLMHSFYRILPVLPYCAQAAPRHVADLCMTAASAGYLNHESVGSVVLALGRDEAARGLKLAGDLAELDPRTVLSGHPLSRIVGTLLNPLFHWHAELKDVCVLLGDWLQAPTLGGRAELTAAALGKLLSPIVQWQTYDHSSVTLHERPLTPTRLLLEIRRAAAALLGQMLSHPHRDVRFRAVSVLDHHGVSQGGRVSTTAFDHAAAEEFEMLVPVLRNRLSREKDVEILFGLYEALATRWASNRPGGDAAAGLLAGRSFDPLVKAYHYASVRAEWFYSFDEVLAEAPEGIGKRWSWWVETYFHRRVRIDERRRVVDDLCARYSSVDELLHCVSVLASSVNPSLILDAWCERNPELFSAAERSLASPEDGLHLRSAVRRTRYKNDPAEMLAELKTLPLPLEPARVNAMIGEAWLTPALAIEVGRYLATQSDVSVRRCALDATFHRDDAPPEAVLDVLEDALRDGDWSGHWDAIWGALQEKSRLALLPTRPQLKRRLEMRFVGGMQSLQEEWHETRVIEALYGENDDLRLDLLATLLMTGTHEAAVKVGRLAAPLANDAQRLAVLIRRMERWMRESGAKGVDRIETILDEGFGEQQLPDGTLSLARAMLNDVDANARAVAMIVLSHLQSSPEACALIAEVAASPNDELQQLGETCLSAFAWPRGWYERRPTLLSLQDTLRSALPLVTQGGSRRITELLRSVEGRLDEDARRDAEEVELY